MKTAALIAANASASTIAQNIEEFGVTKGGMQMISAEAIAAQSSILSGLYITWMPHPSCKLTQAAHEGIKNGMSQCCRIGNRSICICDHPLEHHDEVKLPSKQSHGYIRPPSCKVAKCRCNGFSYCPTRPEECGQWWLPRRRDFDVIAWISVIFYFNMLLDYQ